MMLNLHEVTDDLLAQGIYRNVSLAGEIDPVALAGIAVELAESPDAETCQITLWLSAMRYEVPVGDLVEDVLVILSALGDHFPEIAARSARMIPARA